MAYPTGIPYDSEITPVTRAVTDIAVSGALRGRDYSGGVDHYEITLKHRYITQADVDSLRSSYATDRFTTVTITGNDGESYSCLWVSEPKAVTAKGLLKHATSRFRGTRV